MGKGQRQRPEVRSWGKVKGSQGALRQSVLVPFFSHHLRKACSFVHLSFACRLLSCFHMAILELISPSC